MKFGIFDALGLPLGFYDSEFHGENIPEDAVEISDAQWQDFLENMGRRKWANGEVIEYVSSIIAPENVDSERERRVAAGFMFAGVFYQSRPEDRENIAGAALAALAALGEGAVPGDYRWHGGGTDFMWIAADNTMHPLDAQSTFAMGQAAMAHKQAHIFAARTLKDMNPIPADYATNPAYWP
ncbi:DUF4376 domain-containing protein [Agrobacterium tumefaciens]|uniref:DUF4376 domain-containing protein n=1 Tax=Agrobacterium tumefaciens TaxID=358 RepID=A0AAJ4N1K4_AGRTU|nr:DUF4376 domain-containing protein [Agrobacterium tumefaciens]